MVLYGIMIGGFHASDGPSRGGFHVQKVSNRFFPCLKATCSIFMAEETGEHCLAAVSLLPLLGARLANIPSTFNITFSATLIGPDPSRLCSDWWDHVVADASSLVP